MQSANVKIQIYFSLSGGSGSTFRPETLRLKVEESAPDSLKSFKIGSKIVGKLCIPICDLLRLKTISWWSSPGKLL